MIDKQLFLQRYSEMFKNLGQGDTAGNILGLLMISEKPQLSLDDLSEEIGRSKSTIHSAVKNLLKLGIVEQDIDDTQRSEGRYQHLYTFKKDFWELSLKKAEGIEVFKNLIKDAILHLNSTNKDDERIEPFKEMYALYSWFENRIPQVFAEWEEIRATNMFSPYLIDLDLE